MGPANQTISKNSQQQISTEHTPSKHPKFMNAITGSFKDQSKYLEVSQSIGNVSSYHKWQKSLESIKKSIPSHSLYLPAECENQQEGLCGTAGILKLKFEYFPFLLDQEISNRQFNSLPFEEKELWFLLYILVQTAAATHYTGNYVGDIKPKNIFINESGDISVYSTFSIPEEYTNFQKVRYFKENNYLPPEGVNDIKTGKEFPSYDQKLGQSFSIGLTILDAIFLTDHSFLYDQMENFNEIAFNKIKENVKNLQLNEKLKKVILLMLSMNPDQRLTCIEVYQYLSAYEKQIFQLENFEIKGQIKSKSIILSAQLPSIPSVQASPSRSQQKTSTIKTKRQNLVRYSIGKSDKSRKNEQSNEKQDQNRNQNRVQLVSNQNGISSSQKPHGSNQAQRQMHNYSIQASISSTLKKIDNTNEHSDKNMTSLHANTFENVELGSSNIRKKIVYPTGNTHSNQMSPQQHLEKYEFTKKAEATYANASSQNSPPYMKVGEIKIDSQMTFKTGNLFQRQRSSASLIQSPNRRKSTTLVTEKISFQLPKTSTAHQYAPLYQKTQFRPSFDFISNSTGSNDHYNDFLKQIDKQIEDSKRLFPDSYK